MPTATREDIIQILNRAHRGTADGDIPWERTTSDGLIAYRWTVEESRLRITSTTVELMARDPQSAKWAVARRIIADESMHIVLARLFDRVDTHHNDRFGLGACTSERSAAFDLEQATARWRTRPAGV